MAIPILYNLRSIRERPWTAATTAVGMALVVVVFVAMLALSSGFRTALATTGSDHNALILRKGADTELSSGIAREGVGILRGMPWVARNAADEPLVSPEIYVVINLPRFGTELANVVTRGVSERAFEVRQNVEITRGRRFASGAREIIVGEKLVGRFENCDLGDTLSFANRGWVVVGHFRAGGGAFESEIWAENEQVMPAFRGEVFQSVTCRLADPAAFDEIAATVEADPRIRVDVHRESVFYARQSAALAATLNFLAVFIGGIMAVGAVFGAVNTMDAAVSSRSAEIAILGTLGFKPSRILVSFLAESVAIAAVGGGLGALLSLPLDGMVTSTTNWSTFSEVAFAFEVTPALLAQGFVFSLVMGLVGGFVPALRAARRPVIAGMREA